MRNILLIVIVVYAVLARGQQNATGPEERVYQVVDLMPEYPEGNNAMMQFIGQNTVYPDSAWLQKVQGRSIVDFIVNKDGSLSDLKLVRNLTPETDKEALRVVGLFPRFKPGKQNGQPVRVHMVVPVTFRLDKTKHH